MKIVERYKWQGLGRKILLVALILVLGFIFVLGDRGLLKWYRLRQVGTAMVIKNDSLKVEIESLSDRIRGIEAGDSLELERIARYWGLVRPGEEIYIVREEADTLQAHP